MPFNPLGSAIQDMRIPVVLVFKRQAIRVFPDGTKVATYYNDRINKTITIPYYEIGVNEESKPPEKTIPPPTPLESSLAKFFGVDPNKGMTAQARKVRATTDILGFPKKQKIKEDAMDEGVLRSAKDFIFPKPKGWIPKRLRDKKKVDILSGTNEDAKADLKQTRKWIRGTQMSIAASEYTGKDNSRSKAHLADLNKDKKEQKKSIKAVYAKKNAERTAPKDRNQKLLPFTKWNKSLRVVKG